MHPSFGGCADLRRGVFSGAKLMQRTVFGVKPFMPMALLKVFNIFLFALTVGLILNQSFNSSIGMYDEGFALTNAWRLLNGDIPHRDYWAAYPPGTSIILAFVFGLYEPSLMVARIVNAGWALTLVAASYAIILRLQPVTIASIASLFLAWWFAVAIYPSYSGTSALALSMATDALLVLAATRKDKRAIIAAALVGGTIVIFRHDFAFYTLCASSIALIIDFLILRAKSQTGSGILKPFQPAVMFLSIYISVSLVLLFVLIYRAGFDNVFDQMILLPATGRKENRLLAVLVFLLLFQ